VAGNIGAEPVHSAAGVLEKLILDRAKPAEVESAKRRLVNALDPLMGELQSALDFVAPETLVQTEAAIEANPAQAHEAASQLAKLLSEFDPGAADFIEANRGALRPLFDGTSWVSFAKLVEDYAFTDAQAQLDQALNEHQHA
jgi:hypothetical protein